LASGHFTLLDMRHLEVVSPMPDAATPTARAISITPEARSSQGRAAGEAAQYPTVANSQRHQQVPGSTR
jgi:hypothetical protein